MYYVVHLAGLNQDHKHHVFPISWMRDSKIMLEKFVEKRINKNQVHVFFWSNEKNDDGKPNNNVQPNFNLPVQKKFPPATDGCFLGQPVKFYCDYDEAIACQNRLRDMPPGLYNIRRITEKPAPNLNKIFTNQNANNPIENNDTEPVVNDIVEQQSNEVQNDAAPELNGNIVANPTENDNTEHVLNENDSMASFDELNVSCSSDVSTYASNVSEIDRNDVTSSSNSTSANNGIEVKPELHLNKRADLDGLNAILNDHFIIGGGDAAEANEANDSDSEVEFVILNDVFPKPVQYSCDGLMKQDDDPISGNLAFADAPQVSLCVQ